MQVIDKNRQMLQIIKQVLVLNKVIKNKVFDMVLEQLNIKSII